MRIVVTGASGFVGGALVRRLRRSSMEVIAASRREIPAGLRVADYAEVPSADVLIHLAQDADRGRVNSEGAAAERSAEATLSQLLMKGYSKIVYASSAALYSDKIAAAHGVDDKLHVTDAYTRIKANSEAAVLSGRNRNVVARLANVYGPGMSAANVVTAIVGQIAGDGPIRVRDTAPVRDFIWHEDVAEALAFMATAPGEGVFNVGTGVGTSIAELVHIGLEVAGQSQRPVEASCASASPSTLVLDCSHTRRQYGWQSTVSLREGLAMLLRDFGNGQKNHRDLYRQ